MESMYTMLEVCNFVSYFKPQVCQQLQLQERHNDPQGGLRPQGRYGRAQENHRRF